MMQQPIKNAAFTSHHCSLDSWPATTPATWNRKKNHKIVQSVNLTLTKFSFGRSFHFFWSTFTCELLKKNNNENYLWFCETCLQPLTSPYQVSQSGTFILAALRNQRTTPLLLQQNTQLWNRKWRALTKQHQPGSDIPCEKTFPQPVKTDNKWKYLTTNLSRNLVQSQTSQLTLPTIYQSTHQSINYWKDVKVRTVGVIGRIWDKSIIWVFLSLSSCPAKQVNSFGFLFERECGGLGNACGAVETGGGVGGGKTSRWWEIKWSWEQMPELHEKSEKQQFTTKLIVKTGSCESGQK